MNGFISAVGWSSARLLYTVSTVSSVFFSLSSGFLAGYNLDLTPQREFIHGLALTVVEQIEQRPYSGHWYQPPTWSIPESSQNQELFADTLMTTQPAPLDPVVSIQQEASQEAVQMTFSSALSAEEQSKLRDLLIAEQMVSIAQARPSPTRSARLPKTSKTPVTETTAKTTAETTAVTTDETLTAIASKAATPDCSLTSGTPYLRTSELPIDQPLCPHEATWIAKDWDGKGWVSAKVTHFRETLFLSSGPNTDGILLVDDADLANLAIRSGRRIQEGMGVIVGQLPDGYQVRFAGSSDQPEYFSLKSKKFFAILNVEPGAGVLELFSQNQPEVSATVFVPVIENVSTYLNLTNHTTQDLRIRVVKGEATTENEVSGLTVSLSTHSGIQGITQTDGSALLKSVHYIRGYPIYVDVSSRWGGRTSYTYRFQLKEKDSTGTYLVRELPGDTLDHWLSQVSEGLSPQAALVMGTVDRKKIDGFKFDYRIGVESLNAKSGLEPVVYSVLWDDRISTEFPLEGDVPRFLSIQVPEGLGRIQVLNEMDTPIKSDLFPISPRVIHVISP